MSKKPWVSEVSDKYEELRLKNALKNEIINISQATECGSNQEVKYKSWEKTVQDIFGIEVNEKLTFSASLDDKEENYGDLIASFENLNWCLIEFKKDLDKMEEEKNKFVANRSKKYLDGAGVLRKGKTFVGIQIEKEAFNWLKEKFGAVEKTGFLEPHFIVYGLNSINPKTQESQLQAIRYWDALNKQENKNFPLNKIFDFSEDYENFVKYASLFRVAKNGDFMLANNNSDEGTKGKLKDLSIVIGIDASNKDAKCINTLDSFLRKIEQVEKYSLKNELSIKSNRSGPT